MALKEKITQEELALYEVLKNPVHCSEFIFNLDKTEFDTPFKYDWYQEDFMCDFNPRVSLSCGRSIGKTEALVGIMLWILINDIFPLEYIVYGVPSSVHLESVWTKLLRYFGSNSFLKQLIDKRRGINSSDHSLELATGSKLLCRIAGQTGTGANFVSLHTPFVMIDETGYFPWGAWTELQPIVNTFVNGSRLIASGVPTGLRERNVNFHCDMENSAYTKHKISALQNPRFSEEDRQNAIEQYGGEDSEDYIHLVLGEHGKPIFALFDRTNMLLEPYPVFKLVLEGMKLQDNTQAYISKLSALPHLKSTNSNVYFGIDLGYTEPTAIIIMYEDESGTLKFHSRIRLNKVNYFVQEKLIDWLDSKFNPIVIGIDEGSAGKAVIPTLQDHTDYVHKNFKNRIIPVNFSSQITLGTDADGNEIKSKTKPFSVGVLQDYSNSMRIIYSTMDLEMVSELERMTYTKTHSGEIIYRTLTERGGRRGEDHFTSALLCGSLAYYLSNETLIFKRKSKLAKPFWNLTRQII